MNHLAEQFLLRAIQEWGQSNEERIKAVQDVIDYVGFEAAATCWPVFGGIWPKPCTGQEGEAATKWLKRLTDELLRGKYEEEVKQIAYAMEEAKKARVAK